MILNLKTYSKERTNKNFVLCLTLRYMLAWIQGDKLINDIYFKILVITMYCIIFIDTIFIEDNRMYNAYHYFDFKYVIKWKKHSP